MNSGVSHIQEKFRACGLKSTPQRTAIYQALSQSAAHPTAEELYVEVAPRYPMLSLNTVYYTLGVLQKAGLIKEVNVGHDRARFDANLSPHHHLICQGCHVIVDVMICQGCHVIVDVMDQRLNDLGPPNGLPSDFVIIDHQVVFRGFCGRCRQSAFITNYPGYSPLSTGGTHGKKSQRDEKSRQSQGRIRRRISS